MTAKQDQLKHAQAIRQEKRTKQHMQQQAKMKAYTEQLNQLNESVQCTFIVLFALVTGLPKKKTCVQNRNVYAILHTKISTNKNMSRLCTLKLLAGLSMS